jgi:hypothetical protein
VEERRQTRNKLLLFQWMRRPTLSSSFKRNNCNVPPPCLPLYVAVKPALELRVPTDPSVLCGSPPQKGRFRNPSPPRQRTPVEGLRCYTAKEVRRIVLAKGAKLPPPVQVQ